MATTTNFGWETPDDTDLVKDGAAAMRTLGNSIDTSFVDLKGGTTGQILSKASNTDLDYTWITNDVGDITAVTAGVGISGGGTSGAVTVTRANVGCQLYNSTNALIANNTETALTWNSELFDSHGFHSTSTNTSRITIPTGYAGYYQAVIITTWDIASATGYRAARLHKNGSNVFFSPNVIGSTSAYVGNHVVFNLYLAEGDYLEAKAFQNSGGNLTTYQDYQNAVFSVSYLGA